MRTLNLLECAAFLKIERTHALKLAGKGILPGAKIGRRWVFLEEDLAEYLRSEVRKNQVKATVDAKYAANIASSAAMVKWPRAVARDLKKKSKRPDLSGYNRDGTPKLLKDM